MLFVSFWKVALSNLPVGTFAHKLISAAEATELIASARGKGELVCVSQEDLAAPYQKLALEDHKRMCAALKLHGVEIRLEDFLGSNCVNPLEFASVRAGQHLLVISAHYSFVAVADRPTRIPSPPTEANNAHEVQAAMGRLFEVAPDTITFHLIEAS